MPIRWEDFRADSAAASAAAISFLGGPTGVLLHESAHFVAGNANGLLAGHLIIEKDRRTGSFQPHLDFRDELLRDVHKFAFLCAAGAVAEVYFCKRVGEHRLGRDIETYRQLLPELYTNVAAREIIDDWVDQYLDRIEALSGCIERNFDLCVELCTTDEYLLDDYYVIPTSDLEPPVERSSMECLREYELTASMTARRHALARSVLRKENARDASC